MVLRREEIRRRDRSLESNRDQRLLEGGRAEGHGILARFDYIIEIHAT